MHIGKMQRSPPHVQCCSFCLSATCYSGSNAFVATNLVVVSHSQLHRIVSKGITRQGVVFALLHSCSLQLLFGRGQHGKPFLVQQPIAGDQHSMASLLQFNLSHTEALLGTHKALLLLA